MKKLLYFSIVMIITISSFAQNKGKLTFFSQDGDKFWVIINGEKINKEAQYNVKDISVSFDYGEAKIIFEDSKIPSINKSVQVIDVENNYCHVKYMIKKDKKGKMGIRDFDSTWEVLGPKNASTAVTNTSTPSTVNTTNTTPVTTTSTTTQPNQTTQTYNQTTTTTTNTDEPQNMNIGIGMNITETPDGVNMNVNMGGVNISTNVNGNSNGMNTSTNMNAGGVNSTTGTVTSSTTTTTTTTTSSSSSGFNQQPANNSQNTSIQKEPTQKPVTYVMPGYSGPTGCAMPMSNESFNTAKNSISSKSFEDSKLTIAKQVVGNNCLTCSQVKDIMKLFNFEDSRLEFAKFAYKHTFDIGNYYQLNDAFTFEASIEELNQFVSNGGN